MSDVSAAVCCWCGQPLIQIRQDWRADEWVPEAHYWCSTQACRTRQREWSYVRQHTGWEGKHKPVTRHEYLFVPLPKQATFFESTAPYKLYGGAAGPGKSYALRWGLYRLARVIPNFRALLLRESFGELEQTHFADMDTEQELVGGKFLKGDAMMYFADNKSRIIGGHMQDAGAVKRYLSTNYDVVVADECSLFPPQALLDLSMRARTAKPAAKHYIGEGQFWGGTNPGGPASALLEDFFITHTPDLDQYPQLADKYDPAEWVYTAALLEDNPYTAVAYERKLAVAQKERYQQLRYGDWSVKIGQFFDLFSRRTHERTVSLPMPIRNVVESVDWGFTSPGTIAWYVPLADHHWWVMAEWKFQRMTAEEVARGIVQRRRKLGIAHVAYTVTDPSMHNKTGHARGESFAETFARFGVPSRMGDNDRHMGWPRLTSWYRPAPDGVPWLTYSPECTYSFRSIPGLLADPHDPEDVNSALDDHAADRDRYFVMSRPPLAADGRPVAGPPPEGSWAAWKQYVAQAVGA